MIDPPSLQPFQANIRDASGGARNDSDFEVLAPTDPLPVTFLARVANHVGRWGQIGEKTTSFQAVKLSRQPFRYVIEGDFRIRQR